MTTTDGPEVVVLVQLLRFEHENGRCAVDSDDTHGTKQETVPKINPLTGLLVHEEMRFTQIIDARALDIVEKFNKGSHPHCGHRRVHDALRGLRSKGLIWRNGAGNGQYRYYLTEIGRKKAARLSYALQPA